MAPSDRFQKETNIDFHFFFFLQKDLNLILQHSRNR